MQGWYPGAQGGKALAKIIFGEHSPEGKLPVTFYRSSEELPAFTDYNMKGRTYRYMQNEALYPFGYGLSYTQFAYENVRAKEDQITEEGVTVTMTVKNTGRMAAAETVQAYVKVCCAGTPNAQLKGIKKVWLAAGESTEVTLHLPFEAFGLYNAEGVFEINKTGVEVYVGGHAPDKRSTALTGQEVARLAF
jgi:beta-glucosidase